MKRIDILKQIAYIAAQNEAGVNEVANPNAEWTVSFPSGTGGSTMIDGVKLTPTEQQKVMAMIIHRSFESPTGKARSEQYATVARSIIEDDGMDHVTNGGKLLPLATKMMDATGCSVDTAKRHLVKQLRLMRGEIVAQRGGKREGAGRPKNTPENVGIA